MLAGYRDAVRKDRSVHLEPFVAAHLLRMATEPFRRRVPGWPELTFGLLEQAIRVMEREYEYV